MSEMHRNRHDDLLDGMSGTMESSPVHDTTRRSVLVESGKDMIRKIDETSTDSWFPRAAAPVDPQAGMRDATATALHAATKRPQGGWDPMEVWLRHIDQPRRQRQHAMTDDPRRRG
jgi:hypothetical protein